MRKVLAIGETVLDILFRNQQPVSATPGGSMLNTAVSLGRLNILVFLLSEYASDQIGNLIHDFLNKNGVSTRFITKTNYKTPLALAFLDQENNASYTFYHDKKEASAPPEMLPELLTGDIFLFGSFYSLQKENQEKIKNIIIKGVKKPFICLYDPNFRSAHSRDLEKVLPFIRENISMASIVRASDEDLWNIFQKKDPATIYPVINNLGCKYLIVTCNKNSVHLFTPEIHKQYPINNIQPVSTIGAGDGFNAGLIYAFYQKNITPEQLQYLPEEEWDSIVHTAIRFAESVCMSEENYISTDFNPVL